jgi:hypothetical protein
MPVASRTIREHSRYAAIVVMLAALLLACRPASPPGALPARKRTAVLVADSLAEAAVRNEKQLRLDTVPARTVAVVPFAVDAADTTLLPMAYGLADMLMTDLAQSRQLMLVERLQLHAMLRELELARSGLVDTATASRVGRLVGARRLVVGSLGPVPGGQAVGPAGAQAPRDVVLAARVTDAMTSQPRGEVSGTAPLARIVDAEKALAMRLFAELGVTLDQAERVAVEQNRTGSLAALLAYGRAARAEVDGRYDDAARGYREAQSLDPRFGAARARLDQVRGYTAVPGQHDGERASGIRAAQVATERVNGVLISPIGGTQRPGGLADPAYPAPIATVIIIVTAPR